MGISNETSVRQQTASGFKGRKMKKKPRHLAGKSTVRIRINSETSKFLQGATTVIVGWFAGHTCKNRNKWRI